MTAPSPIVQNSPQDTCRGFRVTDRSAYYVAEEYGPLVPYHAEDEPPIFCWDCHGYIVGPPGRRLCHCQELKVVSPAEAERLRALAALRDALAKSYRHRWFRVLMPLLEAEDEARAAWDGLWSAARSRAARRLAERGLR